MIHQIDLERFETLSATYLGRARQDVLLTRLSTDAQSFAPRGLCRLFEVSDARGCQALLCLYAGVLTLYTADRPPAGLRRELCLFAASLGDAAAEILCPAQLSKTLARGLKKPLSCVSALHLKGVPCTQDSSGCRVHETSDAHAFWQLLCRADSAHSHVAFDAFYCDFFYRKALPAQLFVAERYGLPVGCCSVLHRCGSAAVISDVAVLKEERRRGVATALLREVCRHLLSQGCIPALLCRDRAAAQLYRKLGFEKTGRFGLIQLS